MGTPRVRRGRVLTPGTCRLLGVHAHGPGSRSCGRGIAARTDQAVPAALGCCDLFGAPPAKPEDGALAKAEGVWPRQMDTASGPPGRRDLCPWGCDGHACASCPSSEASAGRGFLVKAGAGRESCLPPRPSATTGPRGLGAPETESGPSGGEVDTTPSAWGRGHSQQHRKGRGTGWAPGLRQAAGTGGIRRPAGRARPAGLGTLALPPARRVWPAAKRLGCGPHPHPVTQGPDQASCRLGAASRQQASQPQAERLGAPAAPVGAGRPAALGAHTHAWVTDPGPLHRQRAQQGPGTRAGLTAAPRADESPA